MYLSSPEEAELYNKFRPSPPDELIKRIVSFMNEKSDCPLDTAVDIGCGSGQSTSVLGPYFKNVVGIDNCEEQLNEASKKSVSKNVTFRLGSADTLNFPDESVQLVTAGQCAHFFDMPKFYKEVDRILKPNGVLAIYGYCLPVCYYKDISLEHLIHNMLLTTIRPYVSDESILVYIQNYKTDAFASFPFSGQPVIREEFVKKFPNATLENLLGYVQSWSGFQRLKRCCGENKAIQILDGFQKEVLETIKKENARPKDVDLSINFKYFLLLGRKV